MTTKNANGHLILAVGLCGSTLVKKLQNRHVENYISPLCLSYYGNHCQPPLSSGLEVFWIFLLRMITKVRVFGAVPGVGKQSFLILQQFKP